MLLALTLGHIFNSIGRQVMIILLEPIKAEIDLIPPSNFAMVLSPLMNRLNLMNALVDEPVVSSPQHSHHALDDTLQDNLVEDSPLEPYLPQVVTQRLLNGQLLAACHAGSARSCAPTTQVSTAP
ncbi:MAG: hypothetical protein CM15mP74_16310 [Halieaceae bacterium]|nr:MAG: hypothetical protein CM15mP74_16310 [Halieaceae bacterium]